MNEKNHNRKDSEVLRIYNAVSAKIFAGEYPAGHRLVEADLARTYGTSRTPARLAIERLASEGLVKHIEHRGAFVRQITISDIEGLFCLREVSEGLAARLASQHATPEDAKVLNDILDSMEKAVTEENLQYYYQLSNQIHNYIFDMTHNEFIADFLKNLNKLTYRFNACIAMMPGRAAASLSEHRNMVNALLSKQEEVAEQVTIQHIKQIREFFVNLKNTEFVRTFSQIDWSDSK